MLKEYKNGGYICICDKILPEGVICCKFKKQPNTRYCKFCGKNIKSRGNICFCNRRCQSKHRIIIKRHICTGCGVKFNRYKSESETYNIYCSQKCFHKNKVISDDFTI